MHRVLIIDDSATMRSILRKAVIAAGVEEAEIATAGDGFEALTFLTQNDVELLLVDLNMPKVDGVKLLQIVRTMPEARRPRVAVVTSQADAETSAYVRGLGAADVIAKPFPPGFLTERVRSLLDGEEMDADDDLMLAVDAEEAVGAAVVEALGALAFSEAVRAPSGIGPEEDVLAATVTFGSERSLLVMVEETTARLLHGRMQGEGAAADDDALLDAVAELANIVGGRAQSLLPDPAMRIPPPTVATIGRDRARELSQVAYAIDFLGAYVFTAIQAR